MTDDKLHIIIAQTYQDDLDEIGKSRQNPHNSTQVTYTTKPTTVLERVRTQPVDIVISGQYFYQNDPVAIMEIAAAAFEPIMPNPQQPTAFRQSVLDSMSNGTELAEHIFDSNPRVLVFRYSMTPDIGGRFVGNIPKSQNRANIVNFIDAPALPEIMHTQDWTRLRESFPEITFYEALERDHRKEV